MKVWDLGILFLLNISVDNNQCGNILLDITHVGR